MVKNFLLLQPPPSSSSQRLCYLFGTAPFFLLTTGASTLPTTSAASGISIHCLGHPQHLEFLHFLALCSSNRSICKCTSTSSVPHSCENIPQGDPQNLELESMGNQLNFRLNPIFGEYNPDLNLEEASKACMTPPKWAG